MKYKILSLPFIVAAIAAVFVSSGTVTAGGKATDENAKAVSVEKFVEGTLTAMESYGHILIRPDSGNLTRLRIGPGAIITHNGKPAKMGDLKVGDKVRVYYDSSSVVTEIQASGP
jgi:hypothetical protein